MTADPLEIQSWLRTRSAELFGRAEDPVRIALTQKGTIIDAVVAFADNSQRIIIKRFSANAMDVAELLQTHQRLIAANPTLSLITPSFLAVDAEKRWIAMTHFPGQTLESRILELTRGGPAGLEQIDRLLNRAGQLLAEFHGVSASQIALRGDRRTNGSFQPSFETYVQRFGWELSLAGMNRGFLDRFLRELDAESLTRVGDRVIPFDAQPKNILVDDDGNLCFIDLAYGVGNPAMGAAQFLVSINRLSLRRPWLRSTLCARWREAFLEGYLPRIPAVFRQDLRFFYPWVILSMIAQHRAARPLFGRLAGLLYARDFAVYLNHLPQGASVATGSVTPEEASAAPVRGRVGVPDRFEARLQTTDTYSVFIQSKIGR